MTGQSVRVDLVSDPNSAISDVARLEKRVEQLSKSFTQQNREAARSAKLAQGSYAQLERELKDNVKQLKQMEIGSRAFTAQKQKVDGLARAMRKAKTEIDSSKDGMSAFGRVTDVVGSRITGVLAGIGLVTGAVRTLGAALEALERGNESKRLSTIDFEKGLSAGKGNFVDPAERAALRSRALEVAGNIGANPGGVAVALGDLKSRGASGLDEATKFLEVAASLNPGDLAGAVALAGAGLVEKRGTGNTNAEEIIGGILSAQVASQTTNPTAFSNAFSANTVALVQSGGFSEEEAREEAAIFSILEPKSADIAATSQKAFSRALRKFAPKADAQAGVTQDVVDAFTGGTLRDRIGILESNDALRNKFIRDLPDEGRDAIVRRIASSAEDRATIDQVRRDVLSGPAAAAQLAQRRQQVQQDAPFLLQQARGEAGKSVNEITAKAEAKLDDAVLKSAETVRAKAFDDNLLGGMAGFIQSRIPGLNVEPATALEAMRRGESQTDSRLRQIGRIAQFDPDDNDRLLAVRELTELLKLAKSQGLDEQTRLIGELLEGVRQTNQLMRQQVAKPDAPPAGPRPLRPPAAAAP